MFFVTHINEQFLQVSTKLHLIQKQWVCVPTSKSRMGMHRQDWQERTLALAKRKEQVKHNKPTSPWRKTTKEMPQSFAS